MRKKIDAMLMTQCLIIGSFVCAYAMAETNVISPGDFLQGVLQAISSFGGMSWVLKISSVITLVIASMKVSLLNQYVWAKLGSFQAWVAPILGIVVGILSILASGGTLTVPTLLAYFSAGAGAIILHELLDTIKAIPGLGSVYVGVIDFIEMTLGGPKSMQSVSPKT